MQAELPPTGAPTDEMGRCVSAILGSTEAESTEKCARAGKTSHPPTLVMFSGATQSGCGFCESRDGAVLLPGRQKVYLDTSSLGSLKIESGDFVRAMSGASPTSLSGGLCDCPRDE